MFAANQGDFRGAVLAAPPDAAALRLASGFAADPLPGRFVFGGGDGSSSSSSN